MRTTLLNPTVWLLAAVLGRAAWGLARAESAGRALDDVVRTATTVPVLAVLALASGGAVASRAVIGYLSPGAYAEEVLAAREFLSERHVYRGDDRAQFARWLREERPATEPWALPGISVCQASAFEHRPQFYTSQAHTPMLLLGSVPLVHLVGGRGLFVGIFGVSAGLLVLAWRTMVREYHLPHTPNALALAAVMLAGWQPVVAGLRQGDAVVAAAALVVISWGLVRRDRPWTAGLAMGIAAALSVPAAFGVLALVRWPRAFAAACLTLAAAIGAVLAFAGPMVFADFAGNMGVAARVYADVVSNYALAGRLVGSHGALAGWVVAAWVVLAFASGWRARTIDASIASFAVLGILAAPIAWSQHMMLAWLPLAWLFARVATGSSSAGLLLWAGAALVVSLPDPAIALLADVLPTLAGVHWPIVPFVLVIVWASVAFAAPRRQTGTAQPASAFS